MMIVQPNEKADYALLWREINGVKRFFNHEGRETVPRKIVNHKTFELAEQELQRGQYGGLALIKDGEPVEFTTVGEATEPITPKAKKSTTKTTESPAMVSGFSQFHTNEADPAKPQKKLTPYTGITLSGIRALVDNPLQVDKAQGQWLIPSTLASRDFSLQEAEGTFYLLWADFDTVPMPVAQIAAVIARVTGDSDYEVYNSHSATKDRPKSRALIPLAKPLSGADWVQCQQVLNDMFNAQGLATDRASERPAQLCYLPNRGAFYESRSQREGVFFDPLTQWAEPLAAKRAAIAEAEASLLAEKVAAQARKAAFNTEHATGGRNAIDAFNECFAVQEILLMNGYAQRGESFRHPRSESGSYSASVKNGRVHALSQSDPLYSHGKGAHSAFSAFTVLMHGGDEKAALKDAGDQWLTIGVEPWNKVVQREYMRDKEAAELAKVDLGGILRQGESTSSSHATDRANPSPTQEKPAGAASEPWPEPIDPFVEQPAPRFPVNHLPAAMAKYCHELAAGSGFDVGGYGFALLIAASNLIDHRARLNIGPMSVPAFMWGGLVDMSGGGKSPIMAAALKFPQRIDNELVHNSHETRTQFIKENPGNKLAEASKPPWKQLIATDTTVEALGELLRDNPAGILIAPDELSAFVGQMDAYNKGSGKDRAAYLQMFDGGSKTINRKSALVPFVVENFSVGVLSGVQPEKLAEMFRKGGADGLFQRFLVYSLRRPGNVDYSAPLGALTESNVGQVFDLLHTWTTQGLKLNMKVDTAVLHMMQSYHQHIRTVALRTPDGRLREHLNKFPGFLARMLFALHYIECAATGRLTDTIGVETFNRANVIAGVLFRHSEAVYEVVEHRGGDAMNLMKSACDAILSKGWQAFKRGDLTTTATGWRDAGKQEAEAAIDLLEEFGWIRDVTPKQQAGKAGRRSSGAFVVNPQALTLFVEHAQRIVSERAERHRAIQKVAAIRKSNPWE